MDSYLNNISGPASCIALSVFAHILFLYPLVFFGNCDFVAPVNRISHIMIELKDTNISPETITKVPNHRPSDSRYRFDNSNDEMGSIVATERNETGKVATSEDQLSGVTTKSTEVIDAEKIDAYHGNSDSVSGTAPIVAEKQILDNAVTLPLRNVGKFPSAVKERLSYRISMFGIPVGSAELEAINENGEIRVTLRTRSNAALSSIYPVDDTIETRHIGENFILTRIRQHEGNFRGDTGFAISLKERSVLWVDRLNTRSIKETIPNSEVLDTLSGFYFLRNRPLQTGKTELLHIYDGETYAPVPVEVLRQETLRLLNFKLVNTLVVHPVQQTDGIFRRTGDIMIWLTDDKNKVPVRIETSIPIGKVVVELISAETE